MSNILLYNLLQWCSQGRDHRRRISGKLDEKNLFWWGQQTRSDGESKGRQLITHGLKDKGPNSDTLRPFTLLAISVLNQAVFVHKAHSIHVTTPLHKNMLVQFCMECAHLWALRALHSGAVRVHTDAKMSKSALWNLQLSSKILQSNSIVLSCVGNIIYFLHAYGCEQRRGCQFSGI